jgi:tRNA(Ile)-lysidine synthase
MRELRAQDAPWPGAVAVSGGSDSVALMLLLADWARQTGEPGPAVLSVDHGLQPGSAAQAAAVVERARHHGLKAEVLVWRGSKPASDIEAAAREARYRLLGEWCSAQGLGALYVAHTIDDQAETFLLRLARGSGVDGLSAMSPIAPIPAGKHRDVVVVRPLLKVSRSFLRCYLEARAERWLEDPMNADSRFARVRMRAAWPALEAAGVSSARVADAARHLARARSALDRTTAELLTRIAHVAPASAVVDRFALASAPEEIGLRALAHLLMHISGRVYRPRFASLETLFCTIRNGELGSGRTLHGCCVYSAPRREAIFGPETLRIVREPQRKSEKSVNRGKK